MAVKPTTPEPRKPNQVQQRSGDQRSGFTLVEVMIAAVLMVIAAIGSMAMFNYGISQNNNSRDKQEQQTAISEDLATIQVLNDRYSCSDPEACAIESSDPGEDGYYAAGPAPSTVFNDACLDGSLLDNLITTLESTPTPNAFSSLGISRMVARAPDPDARYLRYTVTWRGSDGARLRQINLVPTVAGWCP